MKSETPCIWQFSAIMAPTTLRNQITTKL